MKNELNDGTDTASMYSGFESMSRNIRLLNEQDYTFCLMQLNISFSSTCRNFTMNTCIYSKVWGWWRLDLFMNYYLFTWQTQKLKKENKYLRNPSEDVKIDCDDKSRHLDVM